MSDDLRFLVRYVGWWFMWTALTTGAVGLVGWDNPHGWIVLLVALPFAAAHLVWLFHRENKREA